MRDYQEVTDEFVIQGRKILGDNLTGIYLHGSAAMGCFNPKESDIDLLVVVKDALSPGEYGTGEAMAREGTVAESFAAYMLERIRTVCME